MPQHGNGRTSKAIADIVRWIESTSREQRENGSLAPTSASTGDDMDDEHESNERGAGVGNP